MEIKYLIFFAEALVVTLALGTIGVPLARKYKAKQSIREEGPRSHRVKSGTPTMGGAFFLLAMILVIGFNGLWSSSVLWFLVLTLGHGILGGVDDLIKAEKKRNLGLTPMQKIVGQLLLSVIFCMGIAQMSGMSTYIGIPFIHLQVDLGWFFYPFAVIVIVGTSNAVNLTDGLDGLAAGCCTISFMAYALYCFAYGMHEMGYVATILAGCCAGFLFYNYHPARIFMGDTGSLALGGALAAIAIITGTEILLIFLGAVFVAEAASVILQVSSFKLTGRRIFKMSPLHHHFELSGWSEVRVMWAFWAVEGICAASAVMYSIIP